MPFKVRQSVVIFASAVRTPMCLILMSFVAKTPGIPVYSPL